MTNLFTDTRRWANADAWRRDVLELHRVGPIHRIETDEFDPFWAVIDHAAVFDVARRHQDFTNGPEAVLSKRSRIEAKRAKGAETVTLVQMDRPEHRDYRRLTADWFKPSRIERLTGRLQELSNRALATLEASGGRCDFAIDIALPYPLQVILELLGLPESDYERMLKLTQEMFGSSDPDHKPADSDPAATVLEFNRYF
ncbi:MAG: cytochrome P450, partial [Ilumatobacter sp.]